MEELVIIRLRKKKNDELFNHADASKRVSWRTSESDFYGSGVK